MELENLNKHHFNNSEELEFAKKAYIEKAKTLIAELDEAISSMNFIGKYKMLELKNDYETEVGKFKNQIAPKLKTKVTDDLVQTFTRVWSFCIPDLLNINCQDDDPKNSERDELNKELVDAMNEVFQKVDSMDLKFFEEEQAILSLKKAKKHLEYTSDLVKQKEYVGVFADLAGDFVREADSMIKYLEDLQPFQITDLIQPLASNQTNIDNDENAKLGYTVHTFKEDFSNLLDSTAHICSVLKRNPFLHNTYYYLFLTFKYEIQCKFLNVTDNHLVTVSPQCLLFVQVSDLKLTIS